MQTEQNVTRPETINGWIDWAQQHFTAAGLFYGHGTDNAVDEAVYLIAHALNTDYELDGFDPDQTLSGAENDAIAGLFSTRIETKKPAAYLVRQAWFCGLPFYVDERVLVPRSPIAELIEDEFQPWISRDRIKSILEIGTGSGCIALSCAWYMPDVKVTATDIDEAAIEVATRNRSELELDERVTIICSDVFDDVPQQQFDIIVSNPPYVSEQEFADLPVEYKAEPELGLTSGEDGLDCVRKILSRAKDYLSPHGILIVEVGNSQQALQEAYPEVPFLWLEFERGGEGVFLLERDQLLKF